MTFHSATARAPRRSLRSQSGFSLVEMLIVIALIAVVIGLLVGNFGGLLESGSESAAQQFVDSSLEAPLMQYRIHTGSYPTTEEGIGALRTAPANKTARWKGPYIDKMPVDPWGNPYQYRYPGTHNTDKYDLWSLGPDGTPSEDDIGNWE